jgi:Protein of unknown function (DUF4232)
MPASSSSAPAPGPSTPVAAPGQCGDNDLAVTNGTVETAKALRHVAVYFRNASSNPCTLVGYPGADLVTPVGGLLIHVARRPANAAHHLTLNPGDVANADVEAYAWANANGDPCPRYGTLVVTPPNDFVSHTLPVDLPICNATISSVE